MATSLTFVSAREGLRGGAGAAAAAADQADPEGVAAGGVDGGEPGRGDRSGSQELTTRPGHGKPSRKVSGSDLGVSPEFGPTARPAASA